MAEPLSLTGKRWNISQHALQRSASTIVHNLIAERQLEQGKARGTYPDIHRVVTRIQGAVSKNECVGIFGDYDCDGITAAAQLVRYFRRHNTEPTVRLPHREHDGYGLQSETVQWFAQKGVTLLITVDTGIASVEEVNLANSLGIEVIITDHHKPHAEIPSAFALLHPQLSTEYPEPHPAGAGVVYDLITALENNNWEDKDTDTTLAMIGTVADLVPLQGGNRQLVQEGLASLRRLKHCPLAELRESTNSFTSADIAFRIAPRINASGRMSDPSVALSALLEGGPALAMLDELNEQRKALMHDLYNEAVDSFEKPQNLPLLWAASETYPHGVIGLIAGKFTEQFGKPSCVVNISDEVCTASLRSPSCYHITDGLTRCSALLTSFGGHAQAAGCTFPLKHLPALQQALLEDILEHTSEHDLIPSQHIDGVLTLQDITLPFIENLSMLEPYGQGNTEPRFLLQNVQFESVRSVGTDNAHLQCAIGGHKAIGFNLGQLEDACTQKLDIVCRLGIDTWSGKKHSQIVIEYLRVAQREPALLR